MKAVIMAAGEGTRLRPLTYTRPKPMIPIIGKPHLQIILESLKEKANITEIGIIVGHQKDQIEAYFQDGSHLGLDLHYITQPEQLGTGHAALYAKSFIRSEPFLLINGDILLAPDIFNELIQFHRKFPDRSLLSVKQVPDPASYGIVQFNEVTGEVTKIIEKPKDDELFPESYINIGLYIFTPSIFDSIAKTRKSPRGEIEITDSIQILINQGEPVHIFKVDGFWLDLGKPWDLLDANRYFLDRSDLKNQGTLENNITIVGKVGIGQGTRILAGAYIEGPVYIGENCKIGPNCYIRPYCYIANNVHIGHACELKNTIIFDNTTIPHLSYIGDSIIGSGVNLGAGTITANLRFDKNSIKVTIKGAKMDSGRKKMGTIIGDNSQTGIGATIMPGVKIGPNSIVGSNATVYKDVPPNTIYLKKENG
ncbi:MAG: glucose-1-phosphate thymidylyltransferase [Promethearchaeota archaeon]|nr:MAG: glucose-1-phosphate thymidylyltransferase [Candidatus Lokiarchaeota archaeon]